LFVVEYNTSDSSTETSTELLTFIISERVTTARALRSGAVEKTTANSFLGDVKRLLYGEAGNKIHVGGFVSGQSGCVYTAGLWLAAATSPCGNANVFALAEFLLR
jgi:hypothetical protein